MPYPTTPATWVAGDVLTAAQLNAQLRDALLGAFPLGAPDVAWTAYTPVLTQSSAVAKTVNRATYTRVGRMITGAVVLSATAAGVAANAVTVSLPVNAAAGTISLPAGSGGVYDASANTNYEGTVRINSGTTCAIQPYGGPAFLGVSGFTAALAAGDVIAVFFTYEAAT